MSRTCVRTLTLRWTLFVGLLAAIGYLVFWTIAGRLPASDALLVVRDQSHPAVDTLSDLPLQLSRLWDPLVVMLPAAFLAWLFFDYDNLQKKWDPRHGHEGVFWALVLGTVFGVCGCVMIGIFGLSAAVIGAAASSLVVGTATFIGWVGVEKVNPVIAYLIAPVACSIFWGVFTLCMGAEAGFIIGAAALLVTAVVYPLTLGVLWGIRQLRTPFQRVMLSCPNGEH